MKKFISTSIIEFLKENKERNNYKGDIIGDIIYMFRLEDIKANFDKTPPIPVMECTELLQQKNLVMTQY